MPGEPHLLSGCQNCEYKIKSMNEASDILKHLVRVAHMRNITDGGLLLEAQLDPGTVVKMCLWEAHCEDCETYDDFGDGLEQDSQYD